MVEVVDQLERGRAAHDGEQWYDAFQSLSDADRGSPLGPEDLDRLATAAYMLGRHDVHQETLERIHRHHLDAGETLPAARAAFWLGMHLFNEGEVGQAGGWLGRAGRLVGQHEGDCVERGYLLLPQMFQRMGAGDAQTAAELAGQAAAYGERYRDPDLLALAIHSQGHLLINLDRIEEGQALLDEAMLHVKTGELSPIVSGIVYCGVILACQDAFDLRRAKEWTEALSRWCERQADLVAFTGRCLVHRAEILQRDGQWPRALEEARLAQQRCAEARNRRATGEAAYLQGELHRLQGELDEAEEAYREASRWGREPQPGLALLRVAQGDTDAALASIRRALAESEERARRAVLLPAAVEIMLLAGETADARAACDALDAIAAGRRAGMLGAMAAQARGEIELVDGDAAAALACLRRAAAIWDELDAPYDGGRARVLIALACRELGDEDAARLELDGAREVFERLGATDAERLTALDGGPGPADEHGLTPRELEVLRLVAAGRSNKAIAEELVLSERTVHRHVSNIFAKLRVSSRAAATAYAYEHGLL